MKTQEHSLALSRTRHPQTSLNPDWDALVLQLIVICLSGAWFAHSLAQDGPPITSSGLNTQVNLSSPSPLGIIRHDITGGTRAGANLFHSFGDFNVPDHNIANFLNDTGLATSNILGRVTGGNVSTIFGTIQTTGFRDANLFLMNPAGIVFGPTASLNVGGSVTFTTVDYLRLSDGVRFNAAINAAADALLSSSPVAAYGFLGSSPATISVQGSSLGVQPGWSVTLVGGDITIQSGKLGNIGNSGVQPVHQVPSRQVNLASAASSGEFLAGTLDQTPNIDGQSFGELGKIQISEKSVIDASGNGGGTVLIRGGQFVLDNSRISANVTGPGTVTNGVESIGNGIDIVLSRDIAIRNDAVIETNVLGNATPHIEYAGVRVRADRIEIAGTGILSPSSFTGIRSNVGNDAQPSTQGGNSGNITLDANSILIQGFGTLETTVNGASPQPGSPPSPAPTSKSGNIILTANQNIELNGSRIQSFISSHSGAAGNITLTSKHGNIVETGNLPPPGFTPTPGVPFPPVNPNMLFAQSRQSTGKAGNVTLNAPEGDIQLAGAQIVLAIQPLPGGPPTQEAGSGQVQFTARNLRLINGSTVQMDNYSTLPVADFNVSLSGNLTLNSSRIITTARGSAQAADLNVIAKDVIIKDGATLSAETVSSGPGGRLNIITDNLQLTNGGQLRSGNTIPPQFPGVPPPPIPSGSGGIITVHGQASPTDSVLINGPRSGIFTNTEGTGPGGTVNISAKALTIQNGGTISASTTGTDSRAVGGSITVNATDQVTMINSASITASSKGPADAGNISIDAGQRFDMQDSKITTEAEMASGGNIDIKAIDLIRVANGQISSSVQGGPSTAGGNITIDPKTVVLQNAQILANADQGNGGNIQITTPLLLKDSTSIVDASSRFGLSGTVTVQSPTSNISGTVGQLTAKTSPPQVLLQNRCIALAGGEQSTFLLSGRDALPAEPGGWLSSPVAMEHWTGEETEEHVSRLMVRSRGWNTQPPLVMAKDKSTVLSLRRLTPPGFLVRSFATAPTGCSS